MCKYRAVFILALIAFAPTCLANDEDTLRHIKTVLWPRAYLTQDVELLDRLLHDSFEVINADGNRSSKQDELEYMSNNTWNPGNFEYRIDRLDIYSDSFAIVSGTGIADTYTYKSSNVLVKEDGQWRAVASHVSGVKVRNSSE
ncbi:MAG: nuclear transport factor 2 family protein [bacterium]|nr:nuclear transport factor 2 family protein [bacterium]